MSKITILGLGAMGTRMAWNLLKAGHTLTVYNRTPARAALLREAGAQVALTPRDAVRHADITIAMLRDDPAAQAVWFDPVDGAASGLQPGSIAIESSTLSPAFVVRWAGLITDAGARPLEAPVIGSRPQADAAQLIYLIGGDVAVHAAVRPLLAHMGATQHHIGALGQAAAVKLAVNALFSVQVAALAEIRAFLQLHGIPASQALPILNDLPVMSPAAKMAAGLMLADNHAPLFPIALAAKDLAYFCTAATATTADSIVRAARDLLHGATEQGYGASNITGIVRAFDPHPGEGIIAGSAANGGTASSAPAARYKP